MALVTTAAMSLLDIAFEQLYGVTVTYTWVDSHGHLRRGAAWAEGCPDIVTREKAWEAIECLTNSQLAEMYQCKYTIVPRRAK